MHLQVICVTFKGRFLFAVGIVLLAKIDNDNKKAEKIETPNDMKYITIAFINFGMIPYS